MIIFISGSGCRTWISEKCLSFQALSILLANSITPYYVGTRESTDSGFEVYSVRSTAGVASAVVSLMSSGKMGLGRVLKALLGSLNGEADPARGPVQNGHYPYS